MTKTPVEKQIYRVCPRCQNKYVESEIQKLFNQVYEQDSMTDTVYCLRCPDELQKQEGDFNEGCTRIFERNLSETTLTEWAHKLFENEPINQR